MSNRNFVNTIEELENGKVEGDLQIPHGQADFIDFWLGTDGTERNIGDFLVLKETIDPWISKEEIQAYVHRVSQRMAELGIPILFPKDFLPSGPEDRNGGPNLKPVHSVDGRVYIRIGPNTGRMI